MMLLHEHLVVVVGVEVVEVMNVMVLQSLCHQP
jgi:hypothetical protein